MRKTLAILMIVLFMGIVVSCGNKDKNTDYEKYQQKLKELFQKNSPKAELIISISIKQTLLTYVFERTELTLKENKRLFAKKDLVEMKSDLDKVRKILLEMRSNIVGFIELFNKITIEGVERYADDFYKEELKIISIFEKVLDKIKKTTNKRPNSQDIIV